MAGADHRRDRFLALLAIGYDGSRERSEPPPPGAAQGRVEGLVLGQTKGVLAIVLLNAR